MTKIANALNIPASSTTQSLTLGNNNNFLGTNTLDCDGSAAFGTFAGTAAPQNGVTISNFLGVGTKIQAQSNSTAEFVMPPQKTKCDIYITSYVGAFGANGSSLFLCSSKGNQRNPSTSSSQNTLGLIGGIGYTGTAFTNTPRAVISFITTEGWSNTNNGTLINFAVTRNETTTTTTIAQVINKAASTSGVAITNVGSGLLIREGANARMGRATLVPVALSSSVVTVNNNTVTSSTEIFLCCNLRNGVPGILFITARNPGVSFTIASSAIGDASVVSWLLIEPSPPP